MRERGKRFRCRILQRGGVAAGVKRARNGPDSASSAAGAIVGIGESRKKVGGGFGEEPAARDDVVGRGGTTPS